MTAMMFSGLIGQGSQTPPSVMEYAMCVWFDRLDMCSQSNSMGCKRMDKPASLV